MARLYRERFYGMKKRWMILATVFCLLAMGAAAEETPVQLTITGRIIKSSRLSEEGLQAANKLLERMAIRETVWEDGEKAEWIVDGVPLWWVHREKDDDGTLVVFSDVQGYHTAQDEPDVLMLLGGVGREIKNPLFSPDAYKNCAAEIFALLEEAVEPTPQKGSTTVKNAAASPRYDRYTLSAEQMNPLWPVLVQAARPCFDRDGGEREYWESAENVQFTSDVRIKRLYDAAGQDMGVQITGNGIILGTERKISLLMGYTDNKGGSIALSAKALKGKDCLKINGTLKETIRDEKTTYALTCDYSHVLGDEKQSGAFSLNLQKEKEIWTGKAVLERENKTLTLETESRLTETGKQHTVVITEKEKKKTNIQAELVILESPAEVPLAAEVPVKELADLPQAKVRAEMYPEEMILMRAMIYMMNGLPEDERWLLTHELRTDSWHTGEEVPVWTEEDRWIVEEEIP